MQLPVVIFDLNVILSHDVLYVLFFVRCSFFYNYPFLNHNPFLNLLSHPGHILGYPAIDFRMNGVCCCFLLEKEKYMSWYSKVFSHSIVRDKNFPRKCYDR